MGQQQSTTCAQLMFSGDDAKLLETLHSLRPAELDEFLLTPIFDRNTHMLDKHGKPEDLMIPLEYIAHGLCDNPGVVRDVCQLYARRGLVHTVIERFGLPYMMSNVIAPAVRRDLLPVVKTVESVHVDNPWLILEWDVFTMYEGEHVQSTLLHLAAELNSCATLSYFIGLLKDPRCETTKDILTRKNGAGFTPSEAGCGEAVKELIAFEDHVGCSMVRRLSSRSSSMMRRQQQTTTQ